MLRRFRCAGGHWFGSDAHMIAAMIVPGALNGSARFSACQSIIGKPRLKTATSYGSADRVCIGCAWLTYSNPAPTLCAQSSVEAGAC